MVRNNEADEIIYLILLWIKLLVTKKIYKILRRMQIYFISDELGYLVDAIVSDDMIDSFDKRPNDMTIEVRNKFEA